MNKVIVKPAVSHRKRSDSKRPTFQRAIEAVEALAPRERESLFDIFRRRKIEARREELAASIKRAREEYASGGMPGGTVDEVLKALNHCLASR